jgi:hypothetical protein
MCARGMGHVRAGQEVFVREITAAGFKVVGEERILKENYFVRFEKKANDTSFKAWLAVWEYSSSAGS